MIVGKQKLVRYRSAWPKTKLVVVKDVVFVQEAVQGLSGYVFEGLAGYWSEADRSVVKWICSGALFKDWDDMRMFPQVRDYPRAEGLGEKEIERV